MAEAITKTTTLNVFPIVRTIIQSSNLPNLNTKFSLNAHYFEYDPLFLSRNFTGFPYIIIESEFDDEELIMDGDLESLNYTSNILLRMQHHAKGTQTEPFSLANLNAYANAILNYIKQNKGNILDTYKLNHISISGTPADTPMIEGEKISERQIIWNYNVIIDTKT